MKKVYSAPELEVELFDTVVMDLTPGTSTTSFDTNDAVGVTEPGVDGPGTM